MNNVSTPDSCLFIWAICSSFSKSDTARSPFTMALAPTDSATLTTKVDTDTMRKLAHVANVRIVSVSTLVVNVAESVGASAIVKGLRAVSDFENELQMAQMNKQLSGVETLFIPTSSAHSFIASRLLREVARFGGDVTAFVPKVVALRLQEKFADE